MEWDVRQANLDGIKLITSRTSENLDTEIRVIMNVGAYNDTIHGAAHFLEHCVFNGTEKFSGLFRNHVSKLGGSYNAFTSPEITQFEIKIPHSVWKQGVALIADLFHPILDDVQNNLEALTIVNEINDKPFRYPDFPVADRLQTRMWGERMRSGLGTPKSVLAIKKDDLAGFAAQFHVRENCRIIINGGGDHEEMKDVIGKAFQNLPHGQANIHSSLPLNSGYETYSLQDYEAVKSILIFPNSSAKIGLKDSFILNTIKGYLADSNGPAMIDMRDVSRLVYSLYPDSEMGKLNPSLSIGYVSSPDKAEFYTNKIVGHIENLARGNFDYDFMKLGRTQSARADEQYFQNTQYAPIGFVQQGCDREDRPVSPQEFQELSRDMNVSDAITYAAQIVSLGTPGCFAYGNTTGIMDKGQLQNALRPLTKVSGALLAIKS